MSVDYFDHEKLDVYQVSIDLVVLIDTIVELLPRGRAYLVNQLLRAGTSISLNIEEGAGEYSVSEKILFYLLVNQKCYPSQLKKNFLMPLYSLQRAFMRLERGGIVVRHQEGKTTVYEMNPRYPFLKQLKNLLQKAYESFPEEFREKYYEPVYRTRPRRQGKPL